MSSDYDSSAGMIRPADPLVFAGSSTSPVIAPVDSNSVHAGSSIISLVGSPIDLNFQCLSPSLHFPYSLLKIFEVNYYSSSLKD